MRKVKKSKKAAHYSRRLREALTGIGQVEVIYSLSEAELQARDVDRKLALHRYMCAATLN